MSRNARKILSLLSLILLTLILIAAIPVMCLKRGAGIQTPVAVADEVQPTDEAEKTVVTVPADMITEYTGKDKADLIRSSKPGIVINEIFNSLGVDVTKPQEGETKAKGAKDAGVYTVYISPAQNCVWPGGGTEERFFKLTVNKVTLSWMYKGEDVTELYAETTYSWNINRISDITAKYGETITYSKGESDPDDENKRSFKIIKDEKTDVPIKSTVKDAGEYTFTVEDSHNYLNPTFTYKILPRNLNFCDPYYLKWILDDSGYKELNTSQVYEYTYNEVGSTEQRSFYTASEMSHAPYGNWENWKDATKYEYTYNEAESTEVKTYVWPTKLDEAPDESWENWQCVFEPKDDYTQNKTTFAYRQGALNTIRLNNDSGDAAYFAVDYVSGTAGSEPGRYTAVATIKPIPNYTLTYTPSTNLGMEIIPNEDGTYTVTKTWYILQYLNEFIASSSAETGRKEAYVFPEGWTFGSFPEGGISAPCVTHGDEIVKEAGKDAAFRGASQPNGYLLSVNMERIVEVSGNKIIYSVNTDGWQNGSEDIVTFTITCGENIICKDQPRSQFAYYVNEYMPVGKYNITFTSKSVSFRNNHHDWWSGFMGANCGSDYVGTDISFDFEVYTNTACTYNDSLLNFYGHDNVKPFEVNSAEIKGNYDNFFAGTYGIVGVEGAIRKYEILQSGTYWATVADEYFDETPYLTFSLSYENAEYAVGSAEQWAELVSRADTYTFYYAINMRNYNGVVAADGSKYVRITLYEVLEIPEFVKVEYTGKEQTVLPAEEDTRYTISGNVKTEVGIHTAKLTLSDPVHYRWKGVEGATAEAYYEITKAANKWLVALSLGNYKWNSFDASVNAINGTTAVQTPVFKVTTDEEGLIPVTGLASFTATDGKVSAEAEAVFKSLKAGTYHLWATTEETATHKPIPNTHYAFTVELAENAWTTEPNIDSWEDGTEPNLPVAASLYGTVNYKIVAVNDETQVYYDSVSGLDNLVGMHAGRYILIARVEGTQDMYKGIELTKTFVVKSSAATALTIFFIILIAILLIAIAVLVILLIILKKKLNGDGGPEPLKEHQDEGHRIVEEEGEPEEAQPEEEHTADKPEEEQPEEDTADKPEEEQSEEDTADEPEEEQPEEDTADEPEEEQPEEDTADEPEDPQPLYEQHVYGQPAYEQPMYEPMYDMYGRPMYDIYGRPMYQQVYRQPAYQQPVYDQSAYQQPAYEQPVTEQPAVEEPKQEEQPVAEEPTAEETATEETVAEETAAEEPVAEEPVAEETAAEEPEAEETAAEETAAEETVAEEPAADEPVAEETATEEPAAEETVAEETATEEPVAEQPVVEETATEEPVAEEPAAEEPKPDEGEQE